MINKKYKIKKICQQAANKPKQELEYILDDLITHDCRVAADELEKIIRKLERWQRS